MSKNETWRIHQYWQQIGGLLIEEFCAVRPSSSGGTARRLIDGLIVLDEADAIHKGGFYDITGRDVIVIQAKASRLGMYLLGQAYFSRLLVEKLNPRSVKALASAVRMMR